MIAGLAAIGVFLVGVILALYFQWHPSKGEDSGLSLTQEDRTEDDLDRLLAERLLTTIDDALAQTTDPAQRDALFDVRLRAMMGGAE